MREIGCPRGHVGSGRAPWGGILGPSQVLLSLGPPPQWRSSSGTCFISAEIQENIISPSDMSLVKEEVLHSKHTELKDRLRGINQGFDRLRKVSHQGYGAESGTLRAVSGGEEVRPSAPVTPLTQNRPGLWGWGGSRGPWGGRPPVRLCILCKRTWAPLSGGHTQLHFGAMPPL